MKKKSVRASPGKTEATSSIASSDSLLLSKDIIAKVLETAKKIFPFAVSLRRKIHANPELSTHEHETASVVFNELKSLGLSPKYYCKKTGVTATLENGKGKTVVLRADMDALPIEEQTGLSFSSKNAGIMHACGHDMHTAILLASAHVLMQLRETWSGTVVFLFQPSEELAPGGAYTMIQEGAFPDNADAVFGLHVNPEHVAGIVGIKPGPDYAGVVDFDVTINVKGGHGATPNVTADPIVCACAIIQQLQTIVSRESSAGEPCVVTVAKIAAGSKNNIIPTQAVFAGTIRALSDTHLSFVKQRVKDISLTVANSFKAKAEVTFEKAYPPGYNNPELSLHAQRLFSLVLGNNRVVMRTVPTMLAEDFAYFQKKAPGLYVHLGVRPASQKTVPGIHTPQFNPQEEAMLTGILVHSLLAIDILKTET